jgi:hypothetical protein
MHCGIKKECILGGKKCILGGKKISPAGRLLNDDSRQNNIRTQVAHCGAAQAPHLN